MDDKAAMRADARARRRGLDVEERADASIAAVDHLLTLPEVAQATTVALYAPLPDEVDPTAAIEALLLREVTVALPRVRGEHLDLVAITEPSGLEAGFRGILEPAGDPLRDGAVDVIVAPGLAFDGSGGRLGQGGGHYDRLFARHPSAFRVGLCFACQVVDAVPRGPHDEVVDALVTEGGVRRTDGRTRPPS